MFLSMDYVTKISLNGWLHTISMKEKLQVDLHVFLASTVIVYDDTTRVIWDYKKDASRKRFVEQQFNIKMTNHTSRETEVAKSKDKHEEFFTTLTFKSSDKFLKKWMLQFEMFCSSLRGDLMKRPFAKSSCLLIEAVKDVSIRELASDVLRLSSLSYFNSVQISTFSV